MSISVMFECNGCFKREAGTDRIRKTFRSFSGRSWGFGPAGGVYLKTIEDVAPEGWVAYDPYTYCTYCPECWDKVVNGEGDEDVTEGGLDEAMHQRGESDE